MGLLDTPGGAGPAHRSAIVGPTPGVRGIVLAGDPQTSLCPAATKPVAVNALVQEDVTRAASFFVLAFAVSTVGGLLLGDVRVGVRWGFPLGVAFGVFAYVFVVPTADDEPPDV